VSEAGASGALQSTAPVRIGVLGAARITPAALVQPARALPGVEIVAIAARDRARAIAFAAAHGIPEVHGSYEELVADPLVDAVYNPLPNALHGRWTTAAVEAGKHVLCEKPFTANAAEAERVAEAAARSGKVVMEAFHDSYHPLERRARDLVADGRVGVVRRIDVRMIAIVPPRDEVRYSFALGGGSLMDVGCYAIHQLRTFAGAEPVVERARVKLASPNVDRWARAELSLPAGVKARITCALWSTTPPVSGIRVTGEEGTLLVPFPTHPQLVRRIVVTRHGRPNLEKIEGGTTFSYQLRAFRDAVRGGAASPTSPADAVANMRVVDAVYRAAGLPEREPLG
jgi:predicted dehydrogenase